MSLKTTLTLATALTASLLWIGCGGEESTPDPQEQEAPQELQESASPPDSADRPRRPNENTIVEKMDPDGKGMHLTATSPEGKKFQASIGDEVDIPSEFPDDVPIYPGSTPMASMSAPGEGMIVTFKSTEEQQAIFEFYQEGLADNGWEILEDTMFGSQLSLDATKDNRKVSVVIAGTKGDARVSVIVTPEG